MTSSLVKPSARVIFKNPSLCLGSFASIIPPPVYLQTPTPSIKADTVFLLELILIFNLMFSNEIKFPIAAMR